MARNKFPIPNSIQIVKKRNHEPITDSKGVLRTYLQQVNDCTLDSDVEALPDLKLVSAAVRFEVKPPTPTKQLFNIVW